jgi:hypothetical protein
MLQYYECRGNCHSLPLKGNFQSLGGDAEGEAKLGHEGSSTARLRLRR